MYERAPPGQIILASLKLTAGSSSSFSDRPAPSHHRRRSSAGSHTGSKERPANLLQVSLHQANQAPLSPILGTPAEPMSLSRSPSPAPGGGWSSPGLNVNSGRNSPSHAGAAPVHWESARTRHLGVNGYPSFSTHNQGFFIRHMRHLSSGLPRFNSGSDSPPSEKDKLAHGQWPGQNIPLVRRIMSIVGRMGRKLRLRLLIGFAILLCVYIFYHSPLIYHWRRASWGGGGNKFVIILAANVGGGVMEWKGAREWAIERDSVRNKRKYVSNWGYDLEIVDMSTKKKYAHEWRESWEKVDFVRSAMRKYPMAEWFWWLDLNTYIMEPTYSLQNHIFDDLASHIYRDINEFNPLNFTHPFRDPYLDAEALSPVGSGDINSVNLLLSQDCSGFNLGSFFLRRSAWTERLLDIWWDPVAYEQKHMEWDHKEQDALEQMYVSHPWVRKHTGFLPQRKINSFPPAACGQADGKNHTRFHYNEHDRDFVVNMAGCEWGRDCWGEMYHYREFSYWLNRNPWERFKEDLIAVIWYKLTGHWVKL
ncbi:hypothetical protein G6O67_007278 [Ophiocordyceps sinensis]|uniref:Golgi mannosyltransferase complex subunit n=2 Tax=Ophiocordyceps sinensis TaxID=72228 RepID=A0A8H4LUH5_9HYPO|nr:hypothetical protein G6O67_007278 [Ophiocordyceps sinensis]